MNKKTLEKLKESIVFFEENGFNENTYIAKTVKNFLDGTGEINDDSIELSNEYRNHLIRILKAGIKVPQLITSVRTAERERCAKIVGSSILEDKYLDPLEDDSPLDYEINKCRNATLRSIAKTIRED